MTDEKYFGWKTARLEIHERAFRRLFGPRGVKMEAATVVVPTRHPGFSAPTVFPPGAAGPRTSNARNQQLVLLQVAPQAVHGVILESPLENPFSWPFAPPFVFVAGPTHPFTPRAPGEDRITDRGTAFTPAVFAPHAPQPFRFIQPSTWLDISTSDAMNRWKWPVRSFFTLSGHPVCRLKTLKQSIHHAVMGISSDFVDGRRCSCCGGEGKRFWKPSDRL